MNTRILASMLIIGTVAAAAGGSTLALFSDTETSSNNVFAAGALDLEVDWNESYNGENIDNQPLTNNPGPIFELNDVKPGDEGEATVSLHLFNNPGFVDMNVTQTANRENGCTEPEAEVDDTCGNPGQGQGELGENLYFTIWMDDGDNVLEVGEEVLFNGTAHEMAEQKTFWLDGNPDVEGMQAFNNSTTYYVGIKWRVPRSVGNEIQTDSKEFNFTFWAKQARHNEPKDMDDDNGNGVGEEENLTVYWQSELVGGTPIQNLSDQTYHDRNDMIRFAHGVRNESGQFLTRQEDSDQVGCVEEDESEFALLDSQLQINFTVDNPDNDYFSSSTSSDWDGNYEHQWEYKNGMGEEEATCQVSIVSYAKDHPDWDASQAGEQKLFDNMTANLTDGDYTWTVDLPESPSALE